MNTGFRSFSTSSSLLIGAVVALALSSAACSSDSKKGEISDDAGTGGAATGGAATGGAATGGGKGSGGASSGGTTGSGGAGTGGTDAGTDGSPDAGCEYLGAPVIPPASSAVDVPHGLTLLHHYHAVGTQSYECQATAAANVDGGFTYGWAVPFGSKPEAKLLDKCGTEVVHHFENAFGAAPMWQSVADGSSVKGTKLKSAPQAGTIPWLLLKGTATNEADGAIGLLSAVTFVQRLETFGGVAPAAADCDAAHVDEVKAVDYTAEYYFYSGEANDGGT